jgi:hypothetical protein
MLKGGIVGGPSIIFKRLAEAYKSYIRAGLTLHDADKLCKKIIGYDANALYLWVLVKRCPQVNINVLNHMI